MLTADIRKKLGGFLLEVQFETGDGPMALLGASGCGKSVTLKCLAGLLKPDEGRITLDGVTLFDSAAKINLPPQRRRVGYLFQQYALFPTMTVRQNIAAAIPERTGRRAAVDLLLRCFRLEDAASLKPCQLSGGQQQRTALARILASRPRAVLLDEPLSALDSFLKRQLEAELAEVLGGFDGTVLWVTHDRGEAFRNCRRVCVVDGGRSQGVCTTEELFHAPRTSAAARLSGCENITDAVPRGQSVYLPCWRLALDCGRAVPEDVRAAGIRARHVILSSEGETGAFPCTVARVIQDVSATVVLLRPRDADDGAPPLRMELERALWRNIPEAGVLWAAVRPRDILLLK